MNLRQIYLAVNQFSYKPAYRRNLPHVQPPGATFFLTFRLAGSLPQTVLTQWNREREWLAYLAYSNPDYYEQVNQNFERVWFKKFETLLDGASVGPLWLKDPRLAAIVVESLHHRDGTKYQLDAFTIMPNHAHIVIKPLPVLATHPGNLTCITRKKSKAAEVEYHSLASIMQSLKGYTAFRANAVLGRRGEFWAHESYDHWVRDNDEWQRTVAYVLNNPLKAGYVESWQDWKWNYRRGDANW